MLENDVFCHYRRKPHRGAWGMEEVDASSFTEAMKNLRR
jgi:hypothetical protein